MRSKSQMRYLLVTLAGLALRYAVAVPMHASEGVCRACVRDEGAHAAWGEPQQLVEGSLSC